MQELWLQKLPWDVLSLIAAKHGLNPMLIASIIQTESSGNRYCLRYESNWKYFVTPELFAKTLGLTADTEIETQKFSYGLMQLMGSIARELGHVGPMGMLFDVQLNLDLGCKKVSQCVRKYQKLNDAVASYNAGSARYTDGKLVNQEYVDRVMGYLAQAAPAAQGSQQ